MKICNLAVTLLTVTLILGVSQAVHAGPNPPGKPERQTCTLPLHTVIVAADPHACITELIDVWDAIARLPDVEYVPGRDELNLQSKVCAADNKLHAIPPKTQNAIDKLEDIKLTVSNKKKIAKADKDDITKYADIAIGCLLATL